MGGVTICCVEGCSNSNLKARKEGRVLHLYSFPNRAPWMKERREIWAKFVNRVNPDGTPWTPSKNSKICSEHFVGGKKSEDPRHPSYNPTIYDPKVPPKEDPEVLIERYNRVLARWNREREEAKAGGRGGATSSMKAYPTICKITSIPGPVETETLEEDVKPDLSNDLEGIRNENRICLICCESLPPNSNEVFGSDPKFDRFCKLLHPTPGTSQLLNSFKSCDSLSICSRCLSTVDSCVDKNLALNHSSETVRNLQLMLLKEMRIMQTRLIDFQLEMKNLQLSVKSSNESSLTKILTNEESSNAVTSFRSKILEEVQLLEEFGEELQQKMVTPAEPPSPDDSQSVPEPIPQPTSKRPLARPILMGQTIKRGPTPNSKYIVKHIWDGVKFTSIHPPKIPPPEPIPRPVILVKCPGCQKEMKKYCLTAHRRLTCPATAAHRQKKELCHFCAKAFLTKSNLKLHIQQVHCEDRPHKCDRCSKAFKSSQMLKGHQRTHSEERPFLCASCGAAFKHSANRWKHEKLCSKK